MFNQTIGREPEEELAMGKHGVIINSEYVEVP